MDRDAGENGLTRRPPTRGESENAAQAAAALAGARAGNDAPAIRVAGRESVRLAPAVAGLVIDLLRHVANGDMVALVPVGAMLTTRQAAGMLGVPYAHLNRLLDEGEIPFVQEDPHRRMKLTDLLRYRRQCDAAQKKALDRLASLGQEFDAS